MDYNRQLGLMDPRQIGKKSISLIGVGATGSMMAFFLAQLGWGNSPQGCGVLKVFDGDIVENHNLANQMYSHEHVGMAKVNALDDIILKKCGFHIETHNEMVTNQNSVKSTYVCILTDTMKSRKEIFDNCLQFSFDTDLVIETRMGLRDGRIYAFNPSNKDHVEEWKKTLYGDDVAEVSACGASQSIMTTVGFLASLASTRIVQHFNSRYGSGSLNGKDGKMPPMWNEVHFSLYPESFYMRQFGKDPVLVTI
jgi:molybdopterin/thiamine biosynthesis adenylyltransferase